MKDLPHHIKKLNRQVIRSNHREEMEEEAFEIAPLWQKQTIRQEKKQAKARVKKAKQARTPHPLTSDEKNRKMKNRVPIFYDQNHPKTKTTKATRKKTPRI